MAQEIDGSVRDDQPHGLLEDFELFTLLLLQDALVGLGAPRSSVQALGLLALQEQYLTLKFSHAAPEYSYAH